MTPRWWAIRNKWGVLCYPAWTKPGCIANWVKMHGQGMTWRKLYRRGDRVVEIEPPVELRRAIK